MSDFQNDQSVQTQPMDSYPCAPFVRFYFFSLPLGWNAVIVGLLSSVLALIVTLTCLYHFIYGQESKKRSDDSSAAALADKNGTCLPMTISSQRETTALTNEAGTEIKVTTYTEQTCVTINGDLAENGLLTKANGDPSEIRLLQHGHH